MIILHNKSLNMNTIKQKTAALLLITLFVTSHLSNAYACTRVVYQGPNGMVITARSMDWVDEIPADLWIFPRGAERQGEVGIQSFKWKSKYGSVIASTYNISSSDGMNEKGLVANMLWLVESEYPKFDIKGTQQKAIAISLWAQYMLDNFATVAEAVKEISKEPFIVVSDYIPGTNKFTTVHLSLSDANGDNAIFEYVGGKLTIHHNKSYQVMTNSPTFDKQLALNEYWKGIGGTTMLPGTNRAADRFVRASFYVNAIPKTDNTRVAVASMFSVIRNCSVPYGISTPSEPNISNTQWRTVSDQKNKVYYFENVVNPNVVWVDLKKVDFSENAPTKKLALSNGEIFAGETSSSFKSTPAFKFKGLDIK